MWYDLDKFKNMKLDLLIDGKLYPAETIRKMIRERETIEKYFGKIEISEILTQDQRSEEK